MVAKIGIALFSLALLIPRVEAAQNAWVSKSKTKVYMEPSSDSDTVATLAKGQKIKISNEDTDGFYKVKYEDEDGKTRKGWISTKSTSLKPVKLEKMAMSVSDDLDDEEKPKKKKKKKKRDEEDEDDEEYDGESEQGSDWKMGAGPLLALHLGGFSYTGLPFGFGGQFAYNLSDSWIKGMSVKAMLLYTKFTSTYSSSGLSMISVFGGLRYQFPKFIWYAEGGLEYTRFTWNDPYLDKYWSSTGGIGIGLGGGALLDLGDTMKLDLGLGFPFSLRAGLEFRF